MVLPAETEERVKRRALNACQDNLRKVVDVSRKIPQLVEYFASGDKDNARKLLTEIRAGEEEVVKARRMVSQELAEIGAILISREDFLRFTNLSSEIADFSEGIAFYLVEIMEHNWVISTDIKKDLIKLSSAVLDATLKLRETMMVLNYGSQKTLGTSKRRRNRRTHRRRPIPPINNQSFKQQTRHTSPAANPRHPTTTRKLRRQSRRRRRRSTHAFNGNVN